MSRWDTWLAASVAESRNALGDDWLERYLSAPVWCMACAPSVVDDGWWFGVLMPSIDAVGRYFPLLVLIDTDEPPSSPGAWAAFAHWYRDAAACALATLSPEDTLEAFEARLAALASPPEPAPLAIELQPEGDVQALHLPAGSDLPELGAALGMAAWKPLMLGRSLWWPLPGADHALSASPTVYWARGLPPPARFTTMLEGRL